MAAAEASALDGLLVVALEHAVAAPLCTQRLADAGARVIKVERATGDFARDYDHVVHGESAYFVWLNRGKQSIVLDIAQPADAALLESILSRADIFVQNLAPGAAARAGFGSEELRARYPSLITCDISGYGADGPARDMKAYDLLIQCETGLAAITGAPEAPGRVGVSVADIACGLNAYGAIMQALYERTRTGRGCGVAVSLFDSLAEWMTVPLLHFDYGKKAPERVGLCHPSIAPYGAFMCRDGRMVVIAVQNEREWLAFCRDVSGQAELASDPRFSTNDGRVASRPALDALVAGIFADLDWEDAVARLAAAHVAYASVNEVADLSRHGQLRRITTDSPTGPVRLPASPLQWSGATIPPLGVPAPDSHGALIREEFS